MEKKYCWICQQQLAKDEGRECPNCKNFAHKECGSRTKTQNDYPSTQSRWYCKKCVTKYKKGLTKWKREEGLLPPISKAQLKKEEEYRESTKGFSKLSEIFGGDDNIR